MISFEVCSQDREELIDISDRVLAAVDALLAAEDDRTIDADMAGLVAERADRLCLVFVPHTTAGITINENADPDVKIDILKGLGRMVPEDPGFRHAEGNSSAHIKASLMGFSQSIPLVAGRLALGTWQGIQFCEFDGPRRRRVQVSLIG